MRRPSRTDWSPSVAVAAMLAGALLVLSALSATAQGSNVGPPPAPRSWSPPSQFDQLVNRRDPALGALPIVGDDELRGGEDLQGALIGPKLTIYRGVDLSCPPQRVSLDLTAKRSHGKGGLEGPIEHKGQYERDRIRTQCLHPDPIHSVSPGPLKVDAKASVGALYHRAAGPPPGNRSPHGERLHRHVQHVDKAARLVVERDLALQLLA